MGEGNFNILDLCINSALNHYKDAISHLDIPEVNISKILHACLMINDVLSHIETDWMQFACKIGIV